MITVLDWCLLICLHFLFSENFADLFSDHHQWFEGFLNSFRNFLNERVVSKLILGFCWRLVLEHLLPNLVWRHKKSIADCFSRYVLNFHVYITELPFDVLFHSFIEFLHVWLVECESCVFFCFVDIGDGMMVKPYFQEVHKNLSTGGVGFEELVSLKFPLFAKLIGDFFHENGVLVESILILFIVKKWEIGIIKNLIFFFPDKIISCLLSWKGFTSSCIIFVFHLCLCFYYCFPINDVISNILIYSTLLSKLDSIDRSWLIYKLRFQQAFYHKTGPCRNWSK